jgi:CubicO group peptidase (beta-lactamase class C family)
MRLLVLAFCTVLAFCMVVVLPPFALAQSESLDAKVDALFAKWDRPETPGAVVLVTQDGRTAVRRAYGRADLALQVPNLPETVFPLQSASKQFTAAAIHLLVFDGKLSLDDDVRKYLPELHDFGTVIRIRNLLHHTSGIRDVANLMVDAGLRLSDTLDQKDALKLIFAQRDLNFPPGSDFLYSNSNYVLLARIVEKVSGTAFPTFLQKRIFAPLGMIHTGVQADYSVPMRGAANSYNRDDDGTYHFAPANVSYWGAKGVFTTVDDMARWDANFESGVVGGGRLAAALLADARPAILPGGMPISYASGLVISTYRGQAMVWHDGSDAGYDIFHARFPKQKLAISVFANSSDVGTYGKTLRIADLFLDSHFPLPEKYGSPPKPKPKPKPTALAVEGARKAGYFGDYYSAEMNVVYRIVEDGNAVKLVLPRMEFVLRKSGPDRLVASAPIGALTFQRDAAGAVRTMLVDSDDDRNRAMRFARVNLP